MCFPLDEFMSLVLRGYLFYLLKNTAVLFSWEKILRDVKQKIITNRYVFIIDKFYFRYFYDFQ